MDCPKCGKRMIVRNGKRGKFYGCSAYPSCTGTAKYSYTNPRNTTVEKTSPRNWSDFQRNIFDAVGTTEDNLVVEAVAGSGKTVTSVESLKYANRYQNVAFVAFNRSIARDFKDKVPDGVHASTYHSLGLKSIKEARGNIKVEESKNFKIFKGITDQMPIGSQVIAQEYRSEILRLVGLVKNTLVEPSLKGILELSDTYSIDVGSNGESDLVLDTAHKVFVESDRDESQIDFDDMIYWCATGRVDPLAFDLVVTDEMQDTNSARLEMLLKMLRNGGRSVAVGDRKQAIYGWAGANEGAMDVFKQATHAVELPLSITYRCPKSHVALAQQLVPQIQYRENAPEGIVGEILPYRLTSMVQDGDMVMCRVNAPLIRPAFEMLAQGRKAIIVGRDIGANLISLINRIASKNNVTTATAMLGELEEYVGKQCERLEKQGKFGKIEFLQDQLETTEAIAEGCDTVDDVTKKIESIFSDDRSGVRFTSVHRAKGLEADRTFILRPDLMPHPLAKGNPQAMESEMNVKYVALTRSRNEMYFV